MTEDKQNKSWAKDIMAGFIVSLIALPLALGLAIASGVPPMAGIIASVVGGVVVALIGGSHVTITGPGNGLVVVILTTIVALGGDNLFLGYTYALAAIVVSGFVLLILGFLRLGNLADFFPSSTIQGMLSAIGLIIIAKQIHVMLGESGVEAANNLFLLAEIPNSLIRLAKSDSIPYVGIIGIVSLLIMFFYNKIPYKAFHSVPAPMWIVLMAIGFYYYFELFSDLPFPIELESLIQVPENISDSIVFPDFEKWNTSAFAIAVISISLIATIESLLSIKAVDKLDPEKRRSNVNRDLKALGLATIFSGFIGGLPVVTVIARSSVNVNNGANSRKANFSHAAFVALFVVLFSQFLNRIPLSALAGILVYTGYKLASPAQFKKMYKAGKDQFFIFIITLISTLLFGLINGILIGMVTTFLIQLFLMENRMEFFKHPFRSNTLLYEESDGKMYLSVKGHSSFLNFLRLKQQLDSVPNGKEIILDYSLSQFVDSSVMEHLHHYEEDFKKKGGNMEVIGLDIHQSESSHPFAARRMMKLTSIIKKTGFLTDRQHKLKDFAKEISWNFKSNSVFETPVLETFPFFKTKTIDHAYNVFNGIHNGLKFELFDVDFYEGELIARENHKLTMLIIQTGKTIPQFRLDKERIFDRIAGLAGFQDINIEGYEDFSHRFLLRGNDEEAIRSFFTDRLILFFESHPYYHVESNGEYLLIVKGQRLASISEVKALAVFGKDLVAELAV